MRKLTIKRQKSFVGCLVKAKVYIEDTVAPETEINGVPCRKLGDLKSGEEKSFEITNSGAKLFVIADQMSKNFCNEFVNIPEGEEDVYFSGKNYFNPLSGNPFRFDGVTDEETLQNRKENVKKGGPILAVCIAVGFVAGFVVVALMM